MKLYVLMRLTGLSGLSVCFFSDGGGVLMRLMHEESSLGAWVVRNAQNFNSIRILDIPLYRKIYCINLIKIQIL